MKNPGGCVCFFILNSSFFIRNSTGLPSIIARRGGEGMIPTLTRHPEPRRRRRISNRAPRILRSFAPLRMTVSFLAVLFALSAFADAPGVYALTGGTVHPVNAPEIANGIVIIRDGLIEAVGAN